MRHARESRPTELFFLVLLAGIIAAAVTSCGVSQGTGSMQSRRKISAIVRDSILTTISLPKERQFQAPQISNTRQQDTIKVVDFEGHEMFLMKTVIDDDGSTVANQVLDAAVVTARFRHLAERNGKVDIEFQIIVPEALQDSRWQLRYQPTMFVLEDSVKLDRVFVTGKEYRRRQYRGYEMYNNFLRKIVTDSTKIIDMNRLEIFIARNIPEVYKYKNDTSVVNTEDFEGLFGVTEREAVEHYTRRFITRRNERLMAMRDRKYRQYVKAPLITEKLRLDTVIQTSGNYVYNYVQELDLKGKKKLKKVDIVLDGEIYEQDALVYNIPRTEPLSFYISSLSAFVDGTPRYITKVLERRVTANRDYNIDFASGSHEIVTDFGGNASSIRQIQQQLHMLLENEKYDLDSVVVVASASPEGSVAANAALSKRRSENISAFFNSFMKCQIDSLNHEEGVFYNLDETYAAGGRPVRRPIRFNSRFMAENWDGLSELVERDTVMTITDKEDYYALCDIAELDERETRMKSEKWYEYLRSSLYPKLRSVHFQFILHRKGMVQDTMMTTEVDSVYMEGVQAIRDRDYEKAADLLTPYADYNTAIAYSALERNHSALSILEKCEHSAEVSYMLAIIYSRFGEDQKAVQAYMDACNLNGQYVHRGNLDPEISVLIKRYDLNRQEDDDLLL